MSARYPSYAERNIEQTQNEGVGPEETARFRKLHADGLLEAHCDRVLHQIFVPALARRIVERRQQSST